MSYLDSEYDFNELPGSGETNLKEQINECRNILENGTVYGNIEMIEDVVQSCLDFDMNEEGLELINGLLEVAPYNSEFWVKKGLFLNALTKF